MFIILILAHFFIQNQSQNFDPKLDAKVRTHIKAEWQLDDFSLKYVLRVDDTYKNEQLNTLFSIPSRGFVYVGRANSMKDKFDYLILFDKSFTIQKVKVLIYREQHGRQIGEKRWLAQFEGLKLESRPKLGENVDGITGATISASSITSDIHRVLDIINKSIKKGELKS